MGVAVTVAVGAIVTVGALVDVRVADADWVGRGVEVAAGRAAVVVAVRAGVGKVRGVAVAIAVGEDCVGRALGDGDGDGEIVDVGTFVGGVVADGVEVGVRVAVGGGVLVGDDVAVRVGATVLVATAVPVEVGGLVVVVACASAAFAVGMALRVSVDVAVDARVGTADGLGVRVGVRVAVGLAVAVAVAAGVRVDTAVDVELGEDGGMGEAVDCVAVDMGEAAGVLVRVGAGVALAVAVGVMAAVGLAEGMRDAVGDGGRAPADAELASCGAGSVTATGARPGATFVASAPGVAAGLATAGDEAGDASDRAFARGVPALPEFGARLGEEMAATLVPRMGVPTADVAVRFGASRIDVAGERSVGDATGVECGSDGKLGLATDRAPAVADDAGTGAPARGEAISVRRAYACSAAAIVGAVVESDERSPSPRSPISRPSTRLPAIASAPITRRVLVIPPPFIDLAASQP